ncbi:MAG: GAF domain-containing sensor histidine kinase [Nocardioides sp.]
MSASRRIRRRSRRELLAGLLVLGGLAVFVLLVFVVVVLGGGALTGDTSSPHVALSVLATAIVALGFDPVQTRLEEMASRTVHGGQPSPYDALRRFSGTVTGSYPAEELPARMARVLAEGTGAEWSQVWVVVGERPRLAATWPPDATREAAGPDRERPDQEQADRGTPDRRSLPVRHRGELLGVLVVQERDQVRLSPVEERLFEGLAAQAGPVLRGTRLRAELGQRLEELSTRAEELRGSRERLVDVQDEQRRLLERDIHDGAQQHLVALAVNLRLAQTLAERSPDRSVQILSDQRLATTEAIATLDRLARGIYPPRLAEEGLVAALRSAVATSLTPVEVTATDVDRYPADVEAAAYFCTSEAVQNAVKHSGASGIRVSVSGADGALSVLVEDDGTGFDPSTVPTGSGLANMRDRVESVDGTFAVGRSPSGGARIDVRLPTIVTGAAVSGRTG